MSCAAYIAASGPAEGACLAREHAGEAPRAPKLIDVVRDTLRARHYSRWTEKAYIGWIRRYILFHGKRHPRELGAAEATRFLTALAVDAKVSGSTQNQALAALLFLYREVVRVELPWLDELVRARCPRRLPVVLSRDEVCAVIAHLAGTPKLMACLLYGAGLRLLECARLRVKDIDFEASHIVVRAGKGDKDRITVLPRIVREPLRHHLERVRRLHGRDVVSGAGWVELPGTSAGSTRTRLGSGGGSGCSPPPGCSVITRPGSTDAIISTKPSSSAPSATLYARRASRSPQGAIPSATRSPPTCWRTGTTSGPSRNCSVIVT